MLHNRSHHAVAVAAVLGALPAFASSAAATPTRSGAPVRLFVGEQDRAGNALVTRGAQLGGRSGRPDSGLRPDPTRRCRGGGALPAET